MRKNIISVLVAATLPIAGPAIAAKPPTPKISMAHARAAALKLAPGKIISSEYENEGGGWRYSFDIQQKNNVQEIGIDGRTGRIVENKSEGPKDHD
ncbi:MAG: PepSY domain-containing protein [Pseudomonadota bacterium]